MTDVKVFLGGEGQNELGSWYGDPAYQDGDKPGVIESLLRRVQPRGWAVMGARKWCQIRKYRAKGPTPSETQNVLGLVLEARHAGAEVLAFTRDADDDEDRPRVIEEAVTQARALFPAVRIVGGTAIPVLEGWLLALMGEGGTEDLGKAAAQKRLLGKGVEAKNTAAMVAVVDNSDLDDVPRDARSLRGWLHQAQTVLSTEMAES